MVHSMLNTNSHRDRTMLLGLMFARYVPLASQSPYPIIVYFLASYRPHLSQFLENVIFAISTQSLCNYYHLPFTLSMWFQAAEGNMVNGSLLLNLINNNFLIFFNREFSPGGGGGGGVTYWHGRRLSIYQCSTNYTNYSIYERFG